VYDHYFDKVTESVQFFIKLQFFIHLRNCNELLEFFDFFCWNSCCVGPLFLILMVP